MTTHPVTWRLPERPAGIPFAWALQPGRVYHLPRATYYCCAACTLCLAVGVHEAGGMRVMPQGWRLWMGQAYCPEHHAAEMPV